MQAFTAAIPLKACQAYAAMRIHMMLTDVGSTALHPGHVQAPFKLLGLMPFVRS